MGTVRRDGVPAPARVTATLVETLDEGRSRESLELEVFGFLDLALRPSPSPDASATTRAGADGRFAFDGLATGRFVVLAVAEDGAKGEAAAQLRVDGARVEANPDLALRNETLRVRVVRADGRPWKGPVGVRHATRFPSVPLTPDIATDDDGRYVATGLSRGRFVVIAVEARVFKFISEPVEIPFAGEFTLTIDADVRVVAGRVVSTEGSPVASAEVVGSSRQGVRRVVADAAGRFRLALDGGIGQLWARAPGFGMESVEGVTAGQDVEIRLERSKPLVTVSGRVTDPNGRPVAGVAVHRSAIGEDGNVWGSGTPATTGADGRYSMPDVYDGKSAVYAFGGGWISQGFVSPPADGSNPFVVTIADGSDAVVDLVVVPGARIDGHVVQATGSPVGGAVVFASPNREVATDPTADRSRFVPRGSDYWVASSADGSFSIDSLVPGVSYTLRATAAGAADGQAGPVFATRDRGSDVAIRLPPPRSLDVTVVDARTGSPIPDASVSVSWTAPRGSKDTTYGSSTDERRTDASGRLRVDALGDGELSVSAEADGYADAQRNTDVEGSESRADGLAVTVRLVPSSRVAGRVVKPDGSPAAGATVWLKRSKEDPNAGSSGTSDTADAAGAFSFDDVADGWLTLKAGLAREGGGFSSEVPVAAGRTDVVLKLESGRGIVVRVLDPDGNPVPDATVWFYSERTGHSSSYQYGVAVFDDLEDADTVGKILVTEAKRADGTRLPYGPATLENVKRGGTYEIRLPTELLIAGRVVAPDGRGVAGVAVRADIVPTPDTEYASSDEPAKWRLASRRTEVVRTDEKGAFRVGFLGTGEHRLFFRPPPAFAAPQPIKALAGAVGIEVRLRVAVAPKITVLDANGAPVPGARVVVDRRANVTEDSISSLFGEWGAGESVAGADGTVVLAGLDPTVSHVLAVKGPESRSELMHFVEGDWTPRDTTVRLTPGLVVAGTVRDLDGRAMARVKVTCTTADGISAEVWTVADGAFRFTGLRPGDAHLSATIWHGRVALGEDSRSTDATVRAGSEDVVLTLDIGVDLAVRVAGWSERSRVIGAAAMLFDDGPDGIKLLEARVGADGRVLFRGLARDKTYAMWIAADDDGRSVRATGLRPGAEEATAQLVVGKTITVRLEVPSGTSGVAVRVEGPGVLADGVPVADGVYEVRGLPAGTWRVVATARRDGGPIEAVANAAAGGDATLEWKVSR